MRPANPAAASRTRLPRSLRTARLQAGLSIDAAAYLSGLDRRTVQRAERRAPRRRTVVILVSTYTRAQGARRTT